jgi:hypothetical protein
MDHKDIIMALGGPHKLHARLAETGINIQVVTVRSWALAERTIPAKYWSDIKSIAESLDVQITTDMLAAGAAVSQKVPAE